MILIPSAEPGVFQNAEKLCSYNHAIGAYQDCKRACMPVGGVWQEVWPNKHVQVLYNAGQFYANYGLSSAPWNMLTHRFESTYISTAYGDTDYSMIFSFTDPIPKISKVFVSLNYLGGHVSAAGLAVRIANAYANSYDGGGIIAYAECKMAGKSAGEYTVEMDLGQIYENKYLKFWVGYITCQIKKIWVEA